METERSWTSYAGNTGVPSMIPLPSCVLFPARLILPPNRPRNILIPRIAPHRTTGTHASITAKLADRVANDVLDVLIADPGDVVVGPDVVVHQELAGPVDGVGTLVLVDLLAQAAVEAVGELLAVGDQGGAVEGLAVEAVVALAGLEDIDGVVVEVGGGGNSDDSGSESGGDDGEKRGEAHLGNSVLVRGQEWVDVGSKL
jgi:hypothetical protein